MRRSPCPMAPRRQIDFDFRSITTTTAAELKEIFLNFEFTTPLSPKRSKIEPCISLDNPNDDLGSVTTQTTERGVMNSTYIETLSLLVPEGITELNLRLCNKNKFLFSDLIASRKLNLDTVLSNGYDKIYWEVFNKDGSYAGTATIVMQKSDVHTTGRSTSIPEDFGHARYIGKSGDFFNCTKQ